MSSYMRFANPHILDPISMLILYVNCFGSITPDSRFDQGGGWEPDDDNSELPFEARARKRRDLRRIVEHDGHDGRVVVTQDLTPHSLQAPAEHVCIPTQVHDLLPPLCRPVLPHDHLERKICLLGAPRRHRARIHRPRAHPAADQQSTPRVSSQSENSEVVRERNSLCALQATTRAVWLIVDWSAVQNAKKSRECMDVCSVRTKVLAVSSRKWMGRGVVFPFGWSCRFTS
jgi:hypothetical protein